MIDILVVVGVIKGVFYYYFGLKIEFGYVFVDEYISWFVWESWIEFLEIEGDGIEVIKDVFFVGRECVFVKGMCMEYGCLFSNFVYEMVFVDDGFCEWIDWVF